MDPTHQQTPALELRDLAKTFSTRADQDVRAVDGVTLTVRPGEVVALLGPNGAGKTTTLDMVLGLTSPTSGFVSVFGRPPREAVTAGRISAVLQSGGLLRDLTVRETVQMIASLFDDPSSVDEVMTRAGIMKLAAREVSKCSGGEQQRLRFALALLPDPDLLVLDEPTAGMDVAARREFWATMQADADAGRTVVFATHYLEEADTFADRIVLMARGHVVADGSTAEIRARASGRTVSADVPEHEADAFLDRLRHRPDVTDVSMRGNRVVVASSDSDAVARALLVDLGGKNVEIVTASLESAFVAITGEHDDELAHDQQEVLA